MNTKNFEETYQLYHPMIYNYLVNKVKTKEDAEELTQDIFLNCFYYWNRYNEDIASLKTWIFHIANNRLKNYYRDQKNVILVDFDYYDSNDYNQSKYMNFMDEDFTDHLIEQFYKENYIQLLMECLSHRQKEAISLRYYQELTLSEIAQILECSQDNIGVILHRSIKKMREAIREQRYVYGL